MSDKPILYACVGGPPKNWRDLIVVDLDTGLEITGVFEADQKRGCVLRHKGGGYYEYWRGRFEIRVQK